MVERHISQVELGRMAGLTKSEISRMHCKKGIYSDTLENICKVLGVGIEDIMQFKE
jgi:DNA-binding Xre family transcriptional regulator